jgi:hypothetical protein
MPNQEVSVVVRDDGTVVCLDHPECKCFREMGSVKTRRASHVEPYTRGYRMSFHLLRWIFGDQGRVSDWTRSWDVLWRVNLTPVGGPILPGATILREAALRREVEWLNKNLT